MSGFTENAKKADKFRSGLKSTVSLPGDWKGRADWTSFGRTGIGRAKVVFSTAKVFEASLRVAALLANDRRDRLRIEALAATISAGVSCGSTVVTGVLTAGTSGLGTAIFVARAVGSGKSAFDAYEAWRAFFAPPGQPYQKFFEQSRGWQAVGLSLDAIGLVGEILGAGADGLVKTAFKRGVRRGLSPAGLRKYAEWQMRQPGAAGRIIRSALLRQTLFSAKRHYALSTKLATAFTTFQISVYALRAGEFVVDTIQDWGSALQTAGGLWFATEVAPNLPGGAFYWGSP